MAFYDLTKEERLKVVAKISKHILHDLEGSKNLKTSAYFGDSDTYIRKTAYLAMGRTYLQHPQLQATIIAVLDMLQQHTSYSVRQTVINSAGEIGKKDFSIVQHIFDKGLFDNHHAPRNAVIGSVKKMGEVNPIPVLSWAKKYLHHPDKEIRREICHGIELRGRKHPQDILPLLEELQNDKTARVRNTLVHVLGQIAYKKGCLETVVAHLKNWDNQELVNDALLEIIDVHHRYRNFTALTQTEAKKYIQKNFAKRRLK
jgi:3-methyladenine DNA glycosylase AlkC